MLTIFVTQRRRTPAASRATKGSALPESANRAFARWRSAMRWQRAIDEALGPLGLTHTQFLVLHAAVCATEAAADAVSQQDIADAAGLDRVTTSLLVRKLEERGLLDRGVSNSDRRAWRVLVTSGGFEQWRRAVALVVQSSEPHDGE